MRYLVFLLVLFSTALSGQIHDLPTIDSPQDTDRIFTYTRGFSAAYRLDTLKSYFQNGFTGGGSQTLSISGSDLSISDGNTVTLPSYSDQTLSISDFDLSISGGNTIAIPKPTFQQVMNQGQLARFVNPEVTFQSIVASDASATAYIVLGEDAAGASTDLDKNWRLGYNGRNFDIEYRTNTTINKRYLRISPTLDNVEFFADVTAPAFIGDGSGLTGIDVDDADNDPTNELYDDTEIRDSIADHRTEINALPTTDYVDNAQAAAQAYADANDDVDDADNDPTNELYDDSDVIDSLAAHRADIDALQPDGNGIYDGSGNVPDGTSVTGKSHPAGSVGDAELYFSKVISGDYYTGISVVGDNNKGMTLQGRIDGADGEAFSASLQLSVDDDLSSFTQSTWYYNNNTAGYYRGFKWDGATPQMRVGTTDFIDMPDDQPSVDGSVWTVDDDGSGSWQVAPSGSLMAYKSSSTSRTSTTTTVDTDLEHTSVAPGEYEFRAILKYYVLSGSGSLRYKLSRTFALNNFGMSKSTDVGTLSAQEFNYTAPVTGIGSSNINQVIIEGTFTNPSTNDIAIDWGSSDGSETVVMVTGSSFELKKK